MKLIHLLMSLALLTGAGLPAGAFGQESDAKQAKSDLDAFKAYLEKNHAGKKWQTGPSRMDSEEIRKAYPKQRFYFVFSSPPLPPGAPLPDLLKNYEKRVEEFRRDFLSLTIRIDEDGKITPLQKPEDYNQGLIKVASDDDARTAAAAIVALFGSERVGPEAVPLAAVKIRKNDPGWTGNVNKVRAYSAIVTFDGAGKCTRITKLYAGPLPP